MKKFLSPSSLRCIQSLQAKAKHLIGDEEMDTLCEQLLGNNNQVHFVGLGTRWLY